MNVLDFYYDGIQLSDKGYIICYFDGANDRISNGAEITFAEVPIQHGVRKAVAGTSYDTVIETTFSICKDYCSDEVDDIFLSVTDVRDLARWLCRKEYLPFVLLGGGWEDITYFGTFKIEQVRVGDKIMGLNLTLTTNSPFGWQSPVTRTFSNAQSFTINDTSDEVGYLYPNMTLTLRSAGNLTLYNTLLSEYTIVNNCSAGEVVTMQYPIITTSSGTHQLANDFNYIFPRIANTFSITNNTFNLSPNCDVSLTYRPLAKIGV